MNAAADTYFDLQVRFGSTIQEIGNPQALGLVAVDGVSLSAVTTTTHILFPPGSRAEFIVTTPPVGTYGQLATLKYDAGPDGAAIPARALANIVSSGEARAIPLMPAISSPISKSLASLANMKPSRQRKLYFSEALRDEKDPTGPRDYYITLDGATPKTFDMNAKEPDIVTLRMDFRNPEIVGTVVYHCHILEHEDNGMMGSIRVEPPARR